MQCIKSSTEVDKAITGVPVNKMAKGAIVHVVKNSSQFEYQSGNFACSSVCHSFAVGACVFWTNVGSMLYASNDYAHMNSGIPLDIVPKLDVMVRHSVFNGVVFHKFVGVYCAFEAAVRIGIRVIELRDPKAAKTKDSKNYDPIGVRELVEFPQCFTNSIQSAFGIRSLMNPENKEDDLVDAIEMIEAMTVVAITIPTSIDTKTSGHSLAILCQGESK